MKHMNFILTEMTAFRYFVPLILEGNKRGIQSNLFIKGNNKYNNVYLCLDLIADLSTKNNFNVYKIDKVSEHPGLTFMVESCGIEHLNSSHKKITFTYMSDYCILHQHNSYLNQLKI